MFDLYYRNPRLLLLTICIIIVSGTFSFYLLPRMEDPKLVQRVARITTQYPGADPVQVESLVTEKIEDELNEIEEIKEIRSVSKANSSALIIELRDDVTDSEKIWSQVRDRLTDVEPSLPADAEVPEFQELDVKAYAIIVALYWDNDQNTSFTILRRLTDQLKDRLKSVRGTEKVELVAEPEEEITVELDPFRVASLNLTMAEISQLVVGGDSKVPAGQFRSQTSDLLMEVRGRFDSLDRIAQIPIRVGNNQSIVELGDIATISKTIADPPSSLALVDGRPAVALGAFVRSNYRIDWWAAETQIALAEFQSELPEGVGLEVIFEQSSFVERRLNRLFANLLLGGTAVFLVVLVLMGWRNAIIVAIALPLASLMVLSGLNWLGIPIHQMSVTGLIIALGLLIDNAIVIVDEVSRKLRAGMSRLDAVRDGVRHLVVPLFGSTLTTMFAFAPIALMPGPAGEFVGSIAISVILAVISSFFLAMTILPAITAWIYPDSSTRGPDVTGSSSRLASWWQSGISFTWLARWYQGALDWIFARPVFGLLVGIAIPVIGFLQARTLPEQFFPPTDRNQIHIELEMPPIASMSETLESARSIRLALLKNEEVDHVEWFVGESAPQFYYNIIPRQKRNPRYAQAIVRVTRGIDLPSVIHRLQAQMDREFPQARTLVRQLEQGPPFDAPIEVRIFGPDLSRLQDLGDEVRIILAQTPGVIHTRSELSESLPKLELAVDEEQANIAGINLGQIAAQLQATLEGVVGGSVIEATEQLPVRVRTANRDRSNLDRILSLDLLPPSRAAIAGPTAGSTDPLRDSPGVPLAAIGDVELTQQIATINHLKGRRVNEVQAYIPAGVLPANVLGPFQQRLAESAFQLPPGYILRYGGEAAKRDEAIGNLMANVGVLVVLMGATLVLSFSSFRIAAIVAMVGALSVGLGLTSLWMFGFPFGFMAIVGTMGLIGVAINDSIVVLAAIRGNPLAAAGDRQALRDVVTQSTRHVISTSLTTMAGFSPLVLIGGGFWPPLAVAIAGGVGGATLLALFFAPSCYLLLMCRGNRTGDLVVAT